MIIKGKAAEALDDATKHDKVNDEPPPEYSPPPPESQLGESTSLHLDSPPVGFPAPSNYTYIHRTNTAIRDKFTIDPLLVMPEFLLPPLEPSEQRRPNLKLHTTNGSINADVYVYGNQAMSNSNRPRLTAPPGDTKSWPHTIIVANTTNGSIALKIRECPTHPRAPINISASSTCASVTVYLPRSYQGPIVTATSYAKTAFSQELQNNSTTFLEVEGSQTSFVGEYSEWMSSEGRNWTGDTARLTSSFAKIKVAYVDELDNNQGSSGGFVSGLARMFGIS